MALVHPRRGWPLGDGGEPALFRPVSAADAQRPLVRERFLNPLVETRSFS
jgi:hypothetical protein